MIKDKNCILLIYQDYSSFVRYDHLLLEKKQPVLLFRFKISKNIFKTLWVCIKFCKFFVINVPKIKIIFCWFADYHSLLPAFFSRMFNRSYYIAVGGYDAIYIPEIKYGVYSNVFRTLCVGYSLKRATGCLCVSESIKDNLVKKFGNKLNLYVIPTGYDDKKFYYRDDVERTTILTVGMAADLLTIRVKGLDRFTELARTMPHYLFIIIGIGDAAKFFLKPVPENLKLIGYVKHDELVSYYHKARVYAQFSIDEGLPNAVCEAMLCGCIPVGIKAGGIPYAMGPYGLIADKWDPGKCKKLIEMAFDESNQNLGLKAREYILENFSLENREQSFNRLFYS